jgi:hypothetical protein
MHQLKLLGYFRVFDSFPCSSPHHREARWRVIFGFRGTSLPRAFGALYECPDPPLIRRAGTCHPHQGQPGADDRSRNSTNPHSARLGGAKSSRCLAARPAARVFCALLTRHRSRLIAIASRSGALASHSASRIASKNSIALFMPREVRTSTISYCLGDSSR